MRSIADLPPKAGGQAASEPGFRTGRVRWIPAAIVSLWITVFVLSALLALWEPRAAFAMFGAAISLVVTIPIFAASYYLASPYTPFLAIVYFSYGWRGLVVSIGWEGESGLHDRAYLLGESPSYFFIPSAVSLAAFVVLVVVYLCLVSFRGRSRGEQRQRVYRFSGSHILVVLGFAIFGFGAFIAYALMTDGLSLESLSAKRTTIPGLQLGSDYSSYNDLRYLAGFSSVGLWLYCSKLGLARRIRRLKIHELCVASILAVNALLLPFYSSVRGSAILVVATAVLVYIAVAKRAPGKHFVVGLVVAIVILFGTMTSLRSADQTGVAAETSLGQITSSVSAELASNRNFGGMFVFDHIANNVPELIPYQEGGTIAAWVFAFVPRSLWQSKPLISAGPLVGVYIYGTDRSGVPPGLLGDGYLNFGYLGVFVSAIVAAVLLAAMQSAFRNWSEDPGGAVVYFSAPFLVGYYLLNQGIGHALFSVVVGVAPALAAVLLAGRFERRAQTAVSSG